VGVVQESIQEYRRPYLTANLDPVSRGSMDSSQS
jgi:hypothetical protein